jgi:membrane protein implicated in regulation of membrane protease activity
MRAFAIQTGLDLLGPETLPVLLVAAGLVLAILETTAPGAHFIVLGAALFFAGAVGLVATSLGATVLAGPVALGTMVVAFGLATLFTYRNVELYSSEGGRTSDSSSLRGTTGQVTETVTPSGGEIRLDESGFDPHYTARSVDDELAVGTEIIVVDPGGGNVLTVEPFENVDAIDRALSQGRDPVDEREIESEAETDGGAGSPEAERER